MWQARPLNEHLPGWAGAPWTPTPTAKVRRPGREVPAGVHAQDVAGRVADPQPPFGRRRRGEPDGDLAPEAALPLAGDLVAQPGLGDTRAATAAAARLLSRRGRWPVVAGLGGRGRRRAERAADTERG